MFIFERESKVGGRERGRQRTHGRLLAENGDPDVGLELTNHEIMT